MTPRTQSAIGIFCLCGIALAGPAIALFNYRSAPSACILTKADMAPFRFPRTRFPQPMVFEPQSEDGAS